MGNCFSSNKETSPKNTTTGKTRLQTTEKRLGSSKEEKSNVYNEKSKINTVPSKPKNSINKGQGHKLGEDSSPTLDTREAAARAAELRYNNHQENLKESNLKLKNMSKLSKSQKNLA